MRTLLQDLRYSLRQLFQNPGFSLTALISLALGIGAATAVFSVLYSGLLHPYPYRGADNLVTPHIHDQQGGSSVVYLNGSQVRAIEQIPAIECVLATGYHTIDLTGREVPENVSVVGVTGNTFSDLGIPAFFGSRNSTLRCRRGSSAAVRSDNLVRILATPLSFSTRYSRSSTGTRSSELSDRGRRSPAIPLGL